MVMGSISDCSVEAYDDTGAGLAMAHRRPIAFVS